MTVQATASDVGSGLAQDPTGSHAAHERLGPRSAGGDRDRPGRQHRHGDLRLHREPVLPAPGGFGGGGGGGRTAPPVAAPTTEPDDPAEEPAEPAPDEPATDELLGALGPLPERLDEGDPVDVAVSVSRLRFDAASQDAYAGLNGPRLADYALLARDDDFADALAGAPLTARGPLLLTPPDVLGQQAAAELARVLPEGGTLYLLGGPGALSDGVAAAVTNLGLEPVRIAGPSRVETSLAVADRVVALLGGGGNRVMLARAYGPADNPTAAWADAISAGAYGAESGVPVAHDRERGPAPGSGGLVAADGPLGLVARRRGGAVLRRGGGHGRQPDRW